MSQSLVEAVAHGRRLSVTDLDSQLETSGDLALLSQDGQLVALAEYNSGEGWLQPRKVFVVPGS